VSFCAADQEVFVFGTQLVTLNRSQCNQFLGTELGTDFRARRKALREQPPPSGRRRETSAGWLEVDADGHAERVSHTLERRER